MPQKCSKCGAETEYNGDLHCRNIFVEEINKLLSLHELGKAKGLYLSTLFDNAWKENFLYSKGGELKKLIIEEAQKVEDKRKNIRTPHCYACKMLLNNLSGIECSKNVAGLNVRVVPVDVDTTARILTMKIFCKI